MTTAVQPSASSGLDRPSSSSLADVLDTILDKGLVIDAFVRVSLVGIELLTIDARIVVAGVDTYLRFAEAAGRLQLSDTSDSEGLPQLVNDMQSGAAKSKTSGAIEAAGDKVRDFMGRDKDKETAGQDDKKGQKS